MARTLICIPTYNEAENIPGLIKQIFLEQPEISVLVVDDNSPDGTAAIAEELISQYPNLHVLKRTKDKGFANSYKDGFIYAQQNNFDWVLQMDADFSHHPRYIKDMIAKRDNYDCVIGSRYTSGGAVKNWPLKRKVLSRGGNLYVGLWLGTGIRDMTGGFNMWRVNCLDRLGLPDFKSDGYSFLIELKFHARRARLRITETPILFEDRLAAESKMSSSIFREAVIAVPLMRFREGSATNPRKKPAPSPNNVVAFPSPNSENKKKVMGTKFSE